VKFRVNLRGPPRKAKYYCVTDSETVPRGKDEKTFEKRVKKYLKLLRGKRFKPVGAPGAVAIHALGAGQRGLAWRDITSELTEDSTLAERFALTRLVTRIKQSNMCASRKFPSG